MDNDEKIVKLLEEIRDFQKENTERYRDTLEEQKSIYETARKEGKKRWIFVVVFIVTGWILLLAPMFGG